MLKFYFCREVLRNRTPPLFNCIGDRGRGRVELCQSSCCIFLGSSEYHGVPTVMFYELKNNFLGNIIQNPQEIFWASGGWHKVKYPEPGIPCFLSSPVETLQWIGS